MRKYFLFALILASLFYSCKNEVNTIYLVADEVGGLRVETPVTLHGIEIGQIDDIALSPRGQVVLELQLQKEPVLPLDSKFQLGSVGLLGEVELMVELGTEKEMIASGDTLLVFAGPSLFGSDTLSTFLKDVLEGFTRPSNQDSLLIEIRRLNNNLEKWNKNE
ncbi:MlaD family protein [Neolewinella lacunae]|uniref:MCE family protein n=1 Tax=Neolewinella lacunae TaxID=1517758 RepID=A0A923PLL6_9BACT|nr:MCE family protein [Neolewinella lacunae]MBC6993931.1 MCE family protein [Neolewinella lacunae]MDN3634988.1 MlaD family protein [Neolewinella lacunae]